MLNSRNLVDAVVAALQSIPALVTAVAGDQSNIYAHHFFYGTDFSLNEAIYKMTSPSILVAWERTLGGNFDGMTEFKDLVCVYIRAANAAGQEAPLSYEDLWHLMMTSPVNAGTQDIRHIEIVPGEWTLMDVPSIAPLQDAESMDFFKASLVFPQLGDQ
jgi:hypothetical protein